MDVVFGTQETGEATRRISPVDLPGLSAGAETRDCIHRRLGLVALGRTRRQVARGRTTRRAAGFMAAGALSLGALVISPVALATPTQEEVDQARQEVAYAQMSVAQLELQVAAVAQEASEASIAAATAGEAANAAQVRLEEAKATAKSAEAEATASMERFEEGLRQFASVAQVASRGGVSPLDGLAPYLDADGLRTIEQRRNAVASFGAAADSQMQEVAALKQVADLMAATAQKAKIAEEKAYAEATSRAEKAQSAADNAAQVLAQTTQAREALVQELAVKRQTSVQLENERLAAIEAQREAEALAALSANPGPAAGQGGGSTSSSGSATKPSTSRPSSGGSSSSSSSSGSTNSGSSGAGSSGSGSSGSSSSGSSGAGSSGSGSSGSSSSGSSSGGGGTSTGVGGTVLSIAKAQMGKPYVWGGSGPNSFDCSGLVYYSAMQAGKSIGRVASAQYYAGKQVPFSQAQAGDLIFWSSNGSASGIYHVAFYLGGGQLLHAPQPGDVVRTAAMYNAHKLMPYAVRL